MIERDPPLHRMAATIVRTFAPEGEWVSQAGLKSGTLSVEKVRGQIRIRTIMSASESFLSIRDLGCF